MKKITLIIIACTLFTSCNDINRTIFNGKVNECYVSNDKNDFIHKICLNSITKSALINDRIVASYKTYDDNISIQYDGLASIFSSFSNYKFNGECLNHIDNEKMQYCPIDSYTYNLNKKTQCENAGWVWKDSVSINENHCVPSFIKGKINPNIF